MLRNHCTDPVIMCDNLCNKTLYCGHFCPVKCHADACPPGKLSIEKKCECGKSTKDVGCGLEELTFVCTKKCQKRSDCGRHKCGSKCCLMFDHKCTLKCGQVLDCGSHRCQLSCHRGSCRSCNLCSDQFTIRETEDKQGYIIYLSLLFSLT